MQDLLPRLSESLSDTYAIEREIGRGGMATVYLATDLKHRRKVALKVLHPELAATVGHERFLREIEIVAGLTHPRILTLIDSGDAGGLLFYVMPYVEGETLKARLEREGPLAVDESLRIAREVADALAYAHGKGVIHRDIKPSNILFEAGHAVISDFGVARAVGVAGAAGEGDATMTGLAVGTPKYMSPEQASAGEVDGRADVYALGCVLWEMLAGDAPFDGPTPHAILALKSSDSTPSLRTRRKSVPADVEGVIAKAMASLPADRYGTARDFEQALAEPETAEKLRRGRGSRSRAVVGALLVVAATLAAWWMFGRGTPLEAAGPYPLAVLPPENLTGEEEYFIAGQHQALIDQLAGISGLRVISRRSVMRYADTDRAIPEIAAELGVQGVVASSVARQGDSVRLQLQFIEAAPQEHLIWSGSFADVVSQLNGLYGKAARSVAEGAGVELTAAEESRLSGTRVIDPATYEAYLMGMNYLEKRTPEDIQKGLGYLHDATDRNPTDALAWAGLALGYATVGHGPSAPPDVWQRSRAAAERAVRLDPTLAEGWAALADVRTYYEWDWTGAEEAFQRANQLNPNLAMNHYHYAWFLLLMGRFEEAETQHLLAHEIDPLTPFQTATLGWLYAYGGQLGRTLEYARQSLEMDPDGMFGLVVLGSALAAEGKYDEAIAAHERLAELYPVWRWKLGDTYAQAGRTEDARRIAVELEGQQPTPFGALGLATLYAGLGQNDDAFRWLAFEPPHGWVPWAAVDPLLSMPRDDPRFQDFLDRIKLPWRPE